ncbi:MAG: repeat containing protein [Flavipsychrobacter sp.]|nr:repeat containing protein [Flavipsychrobacter sp.]
MKKFLFLLLTMPFLSQAQRIATFAGNGTNGTAVAGTPATAAQIGEIHGIAVDANRNVYIASTIPDQRILKIDTAGIITVFAGNGTKGYSGDGGPATDAQLNYPTSIAFDRAGNAYIADDFNHCIRKVNTSGIISAFAGNGTEGSSGNGGPATAAQLYAPIAVAVDDGGNVYIAQQGDDVIRKVNSLGIISNFAGTGVRDFNGDGGPATIASLAQPNRLAISANGDVYVNDYGNYRVRKIDNSGIITTFAGTGKAGHGPDGVNAQDSPLSPYGLACDNDGNVYIVNVGTCTIHVVDADGVINTIAGNGDYGYNGDCIDPRKAQFRMPDAIAVDANGLVYIADRANNRIRVVGSNCINLGVGELSSNKETISLHPNPVTTTLKITAPDKINEIVIVNYLGQTVYADEYNDAAIEVNVEHLPAGVYFVKVNGLDVRKFVKE